MQLPRLAIVLIAAALPAAANAALCTKENAKEPSDSVVADYNKTGTAFLKFVEDIQDDLRITVSGKLRKRQDYEDSTLNCKDNETCISIELTPMCYDEKTTVIRMADGADTITLKNGDFTLPDNTTGNIYTNTDPLVAAILNAAEEMENEVPERFRSSYREQIAAKRKELLGVSAGNMVVGGGWLAAAAAFAAVLIA